MKNTEVIFKLKDNRKRLTYCSYFNSYLKEAELTKILESTIKIDRFPK